MNAIPIQNPNCFKDALYEILRREFGSYASNIVNRHWNFVYYREKDENGNNAFISWGLFEGVLSSLKEIEGIEFNIKNTMDSNEAQNILIKCAENKSPIMICVDTFFLSFCPKSLGHDIHVLIVEDIDLDKKSAFVSSSLPYKGWISLRELAIARNARINSNMIKNLWFERVLLNENKMEKELSISYIMKALKCNIKKMEETAFTEDQFHGIIGMKKFRDDLALFSKTLSEEKFEIYLLSIFKISKSISEERKRYIGFLIETSKIIDYNMVNIINLYKKIAFSWDIFGNLCFKKTLVPNIETNKIIDRLSALIKEEERALIEMKELVVFFPTINK